MSYSYSSGSDNYYRYEDTFSGFMIITFGTFICLFLIVIMVIVSCICCRVKKPKSTMLIHPLNQLQSGTVGYITHDQVHYIPSPNVPQTQQQSSLPGQPPNRHTILNSAPPSNTDVHH